MTKRLIHILALFVCLSSAWGQQSAPPTQTAAEAKAELELNKKAEGLLIEVTRHARGLRSKENQVLARMAVGDLLWKTHEVTARILFKEASDILRQALISKDDSAPEAAENDRSLSHLRERLLESIGRHDPMMARDLLRGDLRANPADAARDDATPAEDITSADSYTDTKLELSFATQMVEQNPKEAVLIARKALGNGYPHELASLLPKLAEKEPKLAQELAVEIVNKLRKADYGSDYLATGLAVSMARELIYSGKPGPAEDRTKKRTPLLDPETSREFIQFLTDAALEKTLGPSGPVLLMGLRSIIDDLEGFAPAQSALLKERFSEIGKEDNTEASPYYRFQQLRATNDTKAMLEIAGTAPREMRDSLYSQAAYIAWEQGDKAKANEITTKVSNPIERIRLSTDFQEQTIAALIGEQEFVRARQLIGQIRSSERRMQQLIELAEAIIEKGNKKTALEVLQEAQSLMGVKARNEPELEAQFKIAGALSEIDPDRSFAILGPAIYQINELMVATALISNFGRPQGMIKDDEFVLDPALTIPFGFSSLSAKNMRTLAQFDFNKTKEILDRFQRPETRIAAYLRMSGSILQPPPAFDDCTCPERLERLKSNTPDKVEP